MTNSTTDVAIIMGSDSDLPIVEAIFPILESFGVNFTKNVMSAHRTPHEVMELIKSSEDNGCKVFIAAAGMAAHLAVAVGKAGAKNSAILAVQILATSDSELLQKLHDYKNNMREEVLKKDKALNS